MQALPLLDVKTLEVVNLLIAIVAAIVWATTGLAYRGLPTARYLFCSSVALAFGAALLITQSDDNASSASIVAQLSTVFGFWLQYIGVRRFFGRRCRAGAASLAALATLILLIIFHERWLLRNAIFMCAQILPLLALLPLFLKHGSRNSFGIQLAAAGAIIGIFSHIASGAASVALGLGLSDLQSLERLSTYALLLGIAGAALLVFGIALMIIEHLLYEAETMAKRDELTGISNRRDFMLHLERTHALCRTEAIPYSILLIDIDRFKHWNDSYGHAIGDEALRHFTRTAVSRLEATELLARTGGDEFCLLLPGKAEKQAADIASELITEVRSRVICIDDEQLTLTVSVGAATYKPGSQDDYNDILAKADAALYQSKDNGRNQFTAFSKRNGRLSDTNLPSRFRVLEKGGPKPKNGLKRRA